MAQADTIINGTPDQLLGRLSKKAGVLATIVLDRTSGSILKTTGTLTLTHASNAPGIVPALNTASITSDEASGPGQRKGVEEMASMVWNFVNAAGGLVRGLDIEDEVKLLRLRTKKHELVIVPDPKYLFIVVHETQPS